MVRGAAARVAADLEPPTLVTKLRRSFGGNATLLVQLEHGRGDVETDGSVHSSCSGCSSDLSKPRTPRGLCHFQHACTQRLSSAASVATRKPPKDARRHCGSGPLGGRQAVAEGSHSTGWLSWIIWGSPLSQLTAPKRQHTDHKQHESPRAPPAPRGLQLHAQTRSRGAQLPFLISMGAVTGSVVECVTLCGLSDLRATPREIGVVSRAHAIAWPCESIP